MEKVTLNKERKMKKIIVAILFFVVLIIPVNANDFSLIKTKDQKPVFNLLQLTAAASIYTDLVVTYNSIWNSKGKITEANPLWRGLLNKPTFMFFTYTLINIGIVAGSSWLYKKNKFLAWVFIITVNVIEIYCVYSHLRLQKKYM